MLCLERCVLGLGGGGGGGVGGHGTDTEGELSFKAESDPAHSYG